MKQAQNVPSAATLHFANRAWVSGYPAVIGQQRNPFDVGLCNQDPVKRVFMKPRQVVRVYRMFAGDRQFAVTVIEQSAA